MSAIERRILAAIDLLDLTEPVLTAAFELASSANTELHIVHVVEPFLGVDWAESEQLQRDRERVRRRVQDDVDRFCESRRSAAIERIEVRIAAGDAEKEIVRSAAELDVDLLVLGSRGKRGVDRALLGSVSERVVRNAGCAVVVVREKAHDHALKEPAYDPVRAECTVRHAANLAPDHRAIR